MAVILFGTIAGDDPEFGYSWWLMIAAVGMLWILLLPATVIIHQGEKLLSR